MVDTARCAVCGKDHPVATMVTRHRDPEEVPPGAGGAFPEPRDWWLEDAEAAHAQHPRSFFIPPAARRRALRAGDLVRLGFVFGPHADRQEEGHHERMWVEVLEQRQDGHAHGRLRNRPGRLTELQLGDLVAFEPEHVLAIDFSDEELGYAQEQWPVVDEAVLEEDRAPDVVIRGPSPYSAEAEEWWLLVREGGTGPAFESVGLLTDRFPGLETPLRAGSGAWELAEGERASARWRRVPDDELASGDDWVRLRGWLGETAAAMRSSVGPAE